MDRIALGPPFEGVEIEPGQIHFLKRGCNVHTIKPDQNSLVKPGVNFALSGFPEGGKVLVFECPYHEDM